MMDRAIDLALFVHEGQHLSGNDLMNELRRKFGDLSRDDFSRGVAIGCELLEAQAAEHQAEADAIKAELSRRKLVQDEAA